MKRILTGAVLIALVAALIYFDIPWLVTAFSALVALLAALELRGLARQADSPIPLWWTVLVLGATFAASSFPQVEPFAALSFATLLLFTWNAFRLPLARVLPGTAAGVFLVVYVAYPLSLIPRILAQEEGTALLLFLFLCVWCGDIVALYVGRALGRHKLAPNLSPNKTWEGTVGSLLGSVGFGMGLIALGHSLVAHGSTFTRLSTVEPWWQFLLLAILLNLAAQLGDLAESALKRGVGVKDSGNLLPGHGGVLDRMDAFLFTAPVLWFVLLLRDAR